ncbi:MAG: ABC transporter ATP-binding protein [Betaproteobacteria bacterium]|nr:ABC transporter ATP-binding protein [Betaproteobacteria bacterium]
MIKVDRVSVVFNAGTALENRVLSDLSIEIPSGQFVTVIGSNGAGKSTLLNVIAGELPVASGRVVISEQDVTPLPASERSALVARVFQDPRAGTCEVLTVEENLALAASRGGPRGLRLALNAGRRQRFRTALQRLGLGLEHRLGDQIGLLSGGQRQATSLLMASLEPMQILLLDEHVAALDPRTAGFVLDLTRRIIEEQKLTALMVTHSMRHALALGERTLMLHEGRIVLDITGEERRRMTVADLIARFRTQHGAELDSDSLLLS